MGSEVSSQADSDSKLFVCPGRASWAALVQAPQAFCPAGAATDGALLWFKLELSKPVRVPSGGGGREEASLKAQRRTLPKVPKVTARKRRKAQRRGRTLAGGRKTGKTTRTTPSARHRTTCPPAAAFNQPGCADGEKEGVWLAERLETKTRE